jgi:hypothetical protein
MASRGFLHASFLPSSNANHTASATAEAHAGELAASEEQLQEAQADEARAREDLQAAVEARTELEKQLVEERATTKALRETIAAIIERIPAADAGE